MRAKIFSLFLFVLLLTAGGLLNTALAAASGESAAAPVPAEDPRQIVAVLQKAIDANDSDLADSRIDFDRVGTLFFTSTLPQINEAVNSGRLRLPQPLPVLLGSLNSRDLAARRPIQLFLSEEARKFVLYEVASGAFSGNPRQSGKLAEMDGGIFLAMGRVSPGRREFGPAVLTSQDNAGAIVYTTLTDRGSGKKYDVELVLELRNNIWVVVGLENGDELFNKLLKKNGAQGE